jgi:acyl-CoA-binding protein
MAKLQQSFIAAQAAAKNLRGKPENEMLLELYSWFKQATEGDARPSAYDFVARAKHDARGSPLQR